MSKLSRYTIITGTGRSGKTHKAMELARADGRPFGVLVGDGDLPGMCRASEYEGAALAEYEHAALQHLELIVIDDAHLIDCSRWDEILGLPADLIIVTNPPTKVNASPWLGVAATARRIEVRAANNDTVSPEDQARFAALAKVLDPAQGTHDRLNEVEVNLKDPPTRIGGDIE